MTDSETRTGPPVAHEPATPADPAGDEVASAGAEPVPAGPAATGAGGRAVTAHAPAGPADSGPATPPAAGPAPVGPPWRGQVYYLLGGTLPPEYLDWVRRDLTGPRWRLRQAVRPALLVLPFALVFALLPGEVGVRLTIAFCLLAAGVALGLFTSSHFRNRRLVQHGLPPVLPGPGPEDLD